MKFKILIIAFIVGVFLLYSSYGCLLLSLEGMPGTVAENISQKTEMVFLLYGKGLCGVCASGNFFYHQTAKIKANNKNVLVITPKDFSENDIENLKDTFTIQGKIIRGDDDVVTFLKRLAACSNQDDWRHNFYLKVDPGKEISYSELKLF
jgi:hypothetical protein